MTPEGSPRKVVSTVVADVMSKPVLTVEASDNLWDAWQLLFISGMRHLVAVDERGEILGVVSDRNILAEVPATLENLASYRVDQILSRVPTLHVHPDDDPIVAVRLLAEHGVEAIPVLGHDRKLVGILTETDAVRWVAKKALAEAS